MIVNLSIELNYACLGLGIASAMETFYVDNRLKPKQLWSDLWPRTPENITDSGLAIHPGILSYFVAIKFFSKLQADTDYYCHLKGVTLAQSKSSRLGGTLENYNYGKRRLFYLPTTSKANNIFLWRQPARVLQLTFEHLKIWTLNYLPS